MSGQARLRDQELLLLIAQGDEQAFGVLYDRYGRLVFSIALHVTNDHLCADDVTQDVFHRVWTQAHGLRFRAESPGGWIISLTRYRAIDELRSSRYKRDQHEVSRDELSPMVCMDSADDEEHAALRAKVRATLATMAQEQRQAIELAYYRGLSAKEIASTTAHSIGTIKSRLWDGLTVLRCMLRNDTGEAKPTADGNIIEGQVSAG